DEVGQHLAQTLGFAPILTDRQFASFGLDGESAAGGVRRLQGPLCAAKNHRQPLLRVSRADAQTLSDLLDGAAFEVTHPEKFAVSRAQRAESLMRGNLLRKRFEDPH